MAASGAAPGPADSRALGIAALASWLIAEGLGAYMLGAWIASGGPRKQRARPDGLPPLVIFGHAGLALAGFVAWVSHLVTGSAVLAWLAIGFLAAAIGLGLSTVTVWTPYPARRAGAAAPTEHAYRDDQRADMLTEEALARALSDEARTSRLVDDLLASMLAVPRPAARRPKWHLAPLIPAAHGVAAVATILLAVLAAVPAT